MSTPWTSLPTFLNHHGPFKALYDDRRKKIVIVSSIWWAYSNYRLDVGPPNLKEYSLISNLWQRKILEHNKQAAGSFYLSIFDTAAIDPDTNIIYLYNLTGQLTVIKLNDNNNRFKMNTKHLIKFSYSKKQKAVIINKQFHIIDFSNQQHKKYNPDKKIFEILHDLKHIFNTIHEPMNIPITKVGNNLILFGGDSIYNYNINNNEWNKIILKFKYFGGTTCIQIFNGEIILSFGSNPMASNSILIYYVHNEIAKKSYIECPITCETYQLLATKDEAKDNCATFGYVRNEWIKCGLNNHLFPPEYLIRIIYLFYPNEWIHLFTNVSKKHFKINAFDIIKDV